MDDETALLQSTTPTQIATVPFENKVDRWFADGLGKGSDRLLEVPVDDDKCGMDEQTWIGALSPSTQKTKPPLCCLTENSTNPSAGRLVAPFPIFGVRRFWPVLRRLW